MPHVAIDVPEFSRSCFSNVTACLVSRTMLSQDLYTCFCLRLHQRHKASKASWLCITNFAGIWWPECWRATARVTFIEEAFDKHICTRTKQRCSAHVCTCRPSRHVTTGLSHAACVDTQRVANSARKCMNAATHEALLISILWTVNQY